MDVVVTSPAGEMQSIVISMSVCLSAHVSQKPLEVPKIFCVCCISHIAVDDVMFSHSGLCGASCVLLSSESIITATI